MKNTIYLTLLLFATMAGAQNIVFNGTVFKNKLLQSSTSNSIAKDINGTSIKIDANSDSEISVSEVAAVYQLNVSSSSIVNLIGIENFVNLRNLDFSQNSISSVDLSSLINLNTIVANHNNLPTIDVSTLINMTSLDVSNNLLRTIYAKNGNNTDTIDFSGGSNTNILAYICTDESQVGTIASQLPGDSTCIVNSYCTPTPGGNYNTISGSVVFDADSNGIDGSDPKFPFVKVQCQIGTQTLQTTTDTNGQYAFYTQQTSGSYTITPAIENSSVFVIPASTNGTLGSNASYDFPIAPVAVTVPDLEVVVAPNDAAVAGANAVYQVTYKNKGSKSVDGNVTLNYDNSKTSLINCSDVSASTATPGLVVLNFVNLLPFETRSFNVTLAINSGNAIGDDLVFNTSINDNLGATETTTINDNTFSYRQTVGTVTQNAIDCLEGSSVSNAQIGEYLHYKVNFENTGSAVAKNVSIKIAFDPAKYDINSLQILNSSHPLNLRITNSTAVFFMGNVNAGGPGGDGGILLKIKTNNSLPQGSTVASTAQIFFDYDSAFNISLIPNSNVATNNASTTFQNLSATVHNLDVSISVYPNPVQSLVNIAGDSSIKAVQLYDLSGRLLQTNLTDSKNVSMDLNQRAKGVYFLKIESDKGQKIEKIVKD